MRKILLSLLTVFLLVPSAFPIVYAQEESGTDCSQHQDPAVCNNNQNSSECKAYMSCLVSASGSIQEQIKDIEAKREEIAQDIEYYLEQIRDYNAQINELSVQINDLNVQIAALETQIANKQAEIEATQAEIDALIETIKSRMQSNQSGMRLNTMFDFLMGAKTFDDLLRRTSVLNAVSAHENSQKDKLDALIIQLDEDKKILEEDKASLDVAKQDIVVKQQDIAAKKYMAQVVEEELQKQSADLEAQGNQLAANLEEIRAKISEIGADPGASPGWVLPVSGASISAGTWYYPSGGQHLGEDFAAPLGSSVVAVGNGIVLNTVNGCDYGYLGNGCGNAFGGTWGGGNQVYMVINVNGQLYGVKYLHLLKDSIQVSVGDGVTQGQVIASLGSSGNSSGPHLHIEITNLGSTSSSKSYAEKWNGDLTFGAGWGLGSRCDVKGTPCRIRPESVFG